MFAGDKNVITRDQLGAAMALMGEQLSDDDLTEMMNEADMDGNGLIDFEGTPQLAHTC